MLLECIVLELSCLVSFSVIASHALRLFSHFLAGKYRGEHFTSAALIFLG